MIYPFENLSPERFQQFCQALLVREVRDFQCFPVGQPDGGRDATALEVGSKGNEFVVYQVKFVRNPQQITDPHKWLHEVMEEELPKIRTLIPKGAVRYYLLTNVSGTAHLDAGAIDKMNALLTASLTIPGMCFWRDDLSRRLDGAWDLKWTYAELMTGTDLIRLTLECVLNEDKERRSDAIRSFLSCLYDRDKEVRFKQVELQNHLLDLFVDVPITLSAPITRKRKAEQLTYLHRKIAKDVIRMRREEGPSAEIEEEDQAYWHRDRPLIGAADFLLNDLAQSEVPKLVLEGAPGQGKSTITQYICQVHRIRLLNMADELSRLPANHKNSQLRIPFRVDLRDYATWLTGFDPFVSENVARPAGSSKSLESFLCAQVHHFSGGAEFTVNDLHAIGKATPLLLVFDGLDEVAEVSRRKEIISEIAAGCKRLEAIAQKLQAVVTSRPTVLASEVTFRPDEFINHSLASLDKRSLDSYASKWVTARRLDPVQSSDVKRILKEKLGQPHLRDLARNPMQLAILLSLIHTLGSSLPDKRTALYDKYIELFFNREAEKSDVVRNHRDLLIDIHRFLAWKLHSEAELGKERGSITIKELKAVLHEYLTKEGHDPGLTDALFAGMVERVVALVSRVEGTLEFEVQPLREFFAARHLYETAPYSPPGGERLGTKPDRFDGLARNFYWMNVTRFFAGCFSKGELPSLAERLRELVKQDEYCYLSYPRLLAATLLSDWVFAQNPNSMRDIVAMIVDGLGLRFLLSSVERRLGHSGLVSLPKQCGREILTKHCFDLLSESPPFDFALDLIELIRNNNSRQEISELWGDRLWKVPSKDRTKWIHYGVYLGAAGTLDADSVKRILKDQNNALTTINLLIRAGQGDVIQSMPKESKITIDGILDGELRLSRKRPKEALELFMTALDAHRYAIVFHERKPIPLAELWKDNSRYMFHELEPIPSSEQQSSELDDCLRVIRMAETQSKLIATEWATSTDPWSSIIDAAATIYGDRWLLMELANVGAFVKLEPAEDNSVDLFDSTSPLLTRVIAARQRAAQSHWWQGQLNKSDSSPLHKLFVALTLFTWATPSPVLKNINQLDSLISALSEADWERFLTSLEITTSLTSNSRRSNNGTLSLSFTELPSGLSPRTATALSLRAKETLRHDLFDHYLKSYVGESPSLFKHTQALALRRFLSDPANNSDLLKTISQSYVAGNVSEPYSYHYYLRRADIENFPLELARKILSTPYSYPTPLVGIAENSLSIHVSGTAKPLASIALSQHWFDEPAAVSALPR